MGTNELTAKIKELKELEALIDQAQKEVDAIKDLIKNEMTTRETEELQVDVFKVRYTTVKQSRFDTTSFKTKYTELYNQFTKQTTSKRFTIV